MSRRLRRRLTSELLKRQRVLGLLVLLVFASTAPGQMAQSTASLSPGNSQPQPVARVIDLRASDGLS